MSEEEKKAIEILNNYLCETHRKFCSIGAVGIPNKEYFAIEVVLNHITKQEKMIELMAKKFSKTVCFAPLNQKCNQGDKNFDKNKCIECIKQYFENKANEEA